MLAVQQLMIMKPIILLTHKICSILLDLVSVAILLSLAALLQMVVNPAMLILQVTL